jgi:hypothetical protein
MAWSQARAASWTENGDVGLVAGEGGFVDRELLVVSW